MVDNKIYIAILVIILIVIGSQQSTLLWDITREVQDQGYTTFLTREEDIDHTNKNIQDVAQEIKSSTTTAKEAIKKTAEYVAKNIEYSSDLSIQYCYEETATMVLETKIGDCVSMSRLVVALLRAQGIPARTTGGCLTQDRCDTLFAIYPLFEAQVTPMTEEDFKKRGYLHEWVEVWEPSEGWFMVEATSGRVYAIDCDAYLHYHYDANPIERCVIYNQTFWDICYES